MADYTYALTADAVVTDNAGNALAGKKIYIFSSMGGTAITSLKKLDGTALGNYATTDANGRFPFKLTGSPPPSAVWARGDLVAGVDPTWWLLVAAEAYPQITTAISQAAAASTQSAAAEASADAAEAAVATIQSALTALTSRVTNLENAVPPYQGGMWDVGLGASTTWAPIVETDLAGVSLSIPVGGEADKYLVFFVADLGAMTSATANIEARLYVDGVQQAPVLPFNEAANINLRVPVMRVWTITGIAAGNKTFKITILNATTNVYRLYSPHTRLIVVRLP